MRRHAIPIVAGTLGAIWLAAIAIQLCFVAQLAGIPWLIGAIVAQVATFLIASAVMLVSNTRRPAGIDPNAPPNRQRDPFAEPTPALFRDRVQLGDGKPYGSRSSDDLSVVRRLAEHFERDDSARPAPEQSPKWALDLLKENGQIDIGTELFPDPPAAITEGD